MPITNIHKAKHTDGRQVSKADIKLGLEIYAPSMTGGVLRFKCVALDAGKAGFNSLNKEWPIQFTVEFDKPDLTPDEFRLLSEGMSVMNSWNKGNVTSEQRDVIARADEFGYVHQQSYTQANWTELGIAALKLVQNDDVKG